jgi:hypothetical protein
MANKHKGEVALKAGDTTYTLRYGSNSLVELENRFGKNIGEIGQMLKPETLGITEIRALLWCALLKHHPETTEHGAGNIMDDAGMTAALMAAAEAFVLAFPDVAKAAARESKNEKNARAAGTGAAS